MFVLAFPAFSNENRRNTDIFLVFSDFFSMILNLLGAGPQTIHICHKHQKLGEHNYFDTKIPKPLFPTVSNLFHKKHKNRCVCPHFHFFSMIFDVLGARPQTIQICHKHQKLRKHCYFATRLPKPLFF